MSTLVRYIFAGLFLLSSIGCATSAVVSLRVTESRYTRTVEVGQIRFDDSNIIFTQSKLSPEELTDHEIASLEMALRLIFDHDDARFQGKNKIYRVIYRRDSGVIIIVFRGARGINEYIGIVVNNFGNVVIVEEGIRSANKPIW